MSRRGWLPIAGLFGGAFLLRLLVAFVLFPDSGHRSDLQILTDWAHELAANGPGAFYRPDSGYFADYPPVYLSVLWLTGTLGRAWSATFGGGDVTPAMIKLPFMLADLGAGAFVMLLGRRLFGGRAGRIGAAVFLFNPAVILVSTIWGQNDSIATMVALAAAWLLVSGRTEWAAAAAVVAMLVKFQYGIVIPIVAIVGLKRHLLGSSSDAAFDGRREPRRVALSVGAALLALVVTCLPFGLVPFDPGNPSYSLFHRFVGASHAFPGITQNAFNLWMNPVFDIVRVGPGGLTEGHVVDDAAVALSIGAVGLTWQWIGNLLFVAAVAAALLVLRRRDDGPAIAFVALAIAVAFFALPTRVHERYLYPALALGIPFLAVRAGSWRSLYVAISAIAFLDVYWVYSLPIGNAGPGRGILADTVYSPAGIYFLSYLTVIAMIWLVLRALDPIGLPWGVAVPSAATRRELDDDEADHEADHDEAETHQGPGARLAVAVGRLAGPLRALDRRLVGRAPSRTRTIVGIALASLAAAVVAARVGGVDGPWLWNWDMPKIDFPLASLYHEALRAGGLPLWSDRLGLGFPLYAEGQIGAFYPPNWLVFQLPPLLALDATRVLHLALAGTGSGLLALRLTGSRSGALAAALTAVLGGAVVTKLEWHNLVAAYGWLPWVLVPLVRRPSPTRAGLVAAGTLWGIQALAGHPNTWLLTGLVAVVLLLATTPRAATLARVVGFGLLGGAVGAVQLIPTAILMTLSVRSVALSKSDLFTSAATPFDLLGFGFAKPFVQLGSDGSWDLASTWYPDGAFALLEAGAFVGLPILALAAVGLTPRRARPIVIAILVMVAIPVVAAFRPDPWTAIQLLNGLRSPVRSYVVATILIGVLAAFGIGRLGRAGRIGRVGGGARRKLGEAPLRAAVAVGFLLAIQAGFTALAVLRPSTFESLLGASSTWRLPVGEGSRLAVAALTAGWPLVAEVGLGIVAVLVVLAARVEPAARRTLGLAALAVAAVPLVLFGPAPNPVRPETAFSYAGTPFVRAVQGTNAHRLLTIGEPGWYDGVPDQLAAAGVPDIRMFSSLDLLESDRLVETLRGDDPAGDLRRAVGIDVVVTFDKPCPGTTIGEVAQDRATICRVEDALRPPYWIPAADVTFPDPAAGSPIRPREATISLPAALADARPASVKRLDPSTLEATVNAPADGWVWIDRAWWPAWRTTVDGQSVSADRALAGQLLPVRAGRHEIRSELVPWEAGIGLALGLFAVLVAVAWARPRRRAPAGASPEAPSSD